MALTGLGVANLANESNDGMHGPYASVPASQMGNPAKKGKRGSFPLNSLARAKSAESYRRYLPPAKVAPMMHKIHQMYPQLPGAKGY